MSQFNIDRRNFVQGVGATALLGTLGLLGGCAAVGAKSDNLASTGEETAETVDEVIDCDIVIVGAGGSGLAAAVEAGEAGANVLCLERQSAAGGGEVGVEGCFAVGSRMQAEAGVKMSAGSLIRLEMESGQNRISGPGYVDMVHSSGDNLNWLLDHGVSFGKLDADHGEEMVFHRFTSGSGKDDYVAPMLAAAEKAGVQFMYDTLADKLLQDENGVVIGLLATDGAGKRIQVNASSVIVATGGFAEDFDLVSENGINCEEATYVGMPGHDGTAHRMAIAAGAQSNRQRTAYLIAHAVRGLPGYFDGGKFSFVIGVASPFCMWLNERAERFINEDFAGANAMMMTVPTWQNRSTYVLMDQNMLDRYMNGDAEAAEQLAQGLDLGVIVKGETLDAVAEAMQMDPTALAASVERYNGFCSEKLDEDYGKSSDLLVPMEKAPFYGFHLTPDVQVAIGSIKTNRDFNAVDANGEPIDGLYVVGVEGAMLWANIYTINVSGGCNANNVNSGRTAARNALARL